MEYLVHLAVMIAIYAVLAIALDLLAGHTGLLCLAHAGLFGVGAYTSALLTTRWNLGFEISFLGAAGAAVFASLLVSLPSLRLHDDYFVIATFGFQVICFSVFNNWMEVTRGPLGIVGIPPPSLFGWHLRDRTQFLLLAVLLAALAFIITRRVVSAPFGRVLHAVREDEVFGQSLGKNTVFIKVLTFAISAALAGSAGSLFAHYVTYIDPTSFTVMESILIMSMVILGGAGSVWGPIIGAVVLTTLPEALRFMGLPSALASNLRQMIYGGTMVLLMIFRPSGLVGKYGFK